MTHSLVLIDRGPEHNHRYQASCSCGRFKAIPLRLKRSAIRSYHNHVNASRPRRNAAPQWREPTPFDRLPEALKVTA